MGTSSLGEEFSKSKVLNKLGLRGWLKFSVFAEIKKGCVVQFKNKMPDFEARHFRKSPNITY